MPFFRIDVVKGRSDAELREVLDAVHIAMVVAFRVPSGDRYQVIHQHEAEHMIVEDTGLGIKRSDKVVVINMTSRPRTEAEKRSFYVKVCEELKERCGIESSDVVVSISTNTDSDWSFGFGRAQFLTGEL